MRCASRLGVAGPPDRLNVLLRHHLLRQPGGFEGGVPVGEVPDPHDPPTAEGRDLVVQLLVERQSAPLALRVWRSRVATRSPPSTELLRQQPNPSSKVSSRPSKKRITWSAPRAQSAALMRWKHEVDLGIERLDGGVEVTPVIGVDEVSDLVDVLLRHRPRSIPRALVFRASVRITPTHQARRLARRSHRFAIAVARDRFGADPNTEV